MLLNFEESELGILILDILLTEMQMKKNQGENVESTQICTKELYGQMDKRCTIIEIGIYHRSRELRFELPSC